MQNGKYGKKIPDTDMLLELAFCSGSLYNYNYAENYENINVSARTSNDIKFKRILSERTLLGISSGFVPDMTKKISKFISLSDQPYYTNLVTQIQKRSIIISNKRQILPGQLEQVGDKYPFIAKIDYIYAKSRGPTYGVILLDQNDDDEDIISNPKVQGALLVQQEYHKNKTKFVEIMNLKPDKEKAKIIKLELNHETIKSGVLDKIQLSMDNLTRIYYIEQKHYPNQSDKCVRCTQRGRCFSLARFREDVRGNIRIIR